MKKTQIRERLIMQQLDISHIEQFNELLRYAFQVTDSDLLEFGWNNEEIKRSKYPILQNASVLGWFDRQKLISQIALYPMQMNIYNRIYAMGGITGVATYPLPRLLFFHFHLFSNNYQIPLFKALIFSFDYHLFSFVFFWFGNF